VTSIKNEAFSGCTGLTSVVISNSVTSINATAFDGCGNLTPESAARIEKLTVMPVEVVMKHPQSVRKVISYFEGSPSIRWKWTTTFSAKDDKGGFELVSDTYTIENGDKMWKPRWGAKSSVSVEKGKSGSTIISLIEEEFRGGVFVRKWHGVDEYGNKIDIITETVKLE
jgi:hypothetical protein